MDAADQPNQNTNPNEDSPNYTFSNRQTYELIKKVLKLSKGEKLEGVLANKKQYLQSKFKICTVSGKELIVHQKTNLPLLIQEDAEGTIDQFHRQSHSGSRATYSKIKEHFYHVPFELVLKFVEKCEPCCKKRIPFKPPVGKPIISNGILHRIQIDLIDLSHSPDGEYRYVLQVCAF